MRRGSSVADIGSDHALLPCYLWQSGWTDIIASDINEKPLVNAKKTLERYGATGVRLILSDGFSGLPPRDDIIIAGMGGETIAEMLGGCRFKGTDTRFILQPMTRHEELRRGLYRLGFEIIEEKFAFCSKKTYTVIHARYTGEKCVISDVFAYTGKQGNQIYIKNTLNKIMKKAKGDPKFNELAEEIHKLYFR